MGLTKPRAYQIFDIDYKQAVRVITISNITLSGGAPSTVDGVSLSVGDRILVAGQSTGSQNGLYQVSVLGTGSNGTWIRSVDTNENGELNAGTIVMVTEGATYKDTQWKLTTNDPIIIGTTALVFEQNSAFAFGNIYANSTAVLADIVGDTVTFTPSNNMVILANATSDTITFEVSQSPNFTGTFQVSGTVGSNLIPTANNTYNLGNTTNRWNDIWLSNSTIYLGNAQISANATSLILTNPQGAQTVLSGPVANVTAANASIGNLLISGNIFDSGTSLQINTTTAANISLAPNQSVVLTATTTGANITGTLNATGNANVGNLGATNAVLAGTLTGVTTIGASGNISATGNIQGGNVISNALVSAVTVTATGNISATGNVSGGNLLLSGNIFDSGTSLQLNTTSAANIVLAPNQSAVITATTTGANITGTLNATGNANVGNLGTAGQITSTGNVTAGGIVTTGNVSANYFLGNVACAAGIFATKIFSGTSEANIVSSGGNLAITIGGVSNVMVVSTIGANVSGTLGVTGNITGGNVAGTLLTGTLTTAAQPNVTSVGTLSSLTVTGNVAGGNLTTTGTGTIGTLNVTGNALIAGNLIVDGTTTQINITDLNVEDPIIGLGRGPNNAPLTVNDGKDRGEQLWYFDTTEKSAFIGYDNSIGKLIAAVNTSIANEIVTVNSYGNFIVGGLEATTGGFSGNVTTGNVSGTNGTFTNVSGTLTTAAQPNITSVGSLTLLTVTGNANVGNIGGTRAVFTNLVGTLETAAQPNVTSLGTLTSLSVSGNISGGNLNVTGGIFDTGVLSLTTTTASNIALAVNNGNIVVVTATGANIAGTLNATGNANVGNIGATNGVFTNVTGTLTTAAQPNVTSLGTLTSLTVTGNVTGGNLVTAGLVSATGNVNAGGFSTTGNISGGNILGNGRSLTGIEAFRSFAVSGGNTIVADSITDTFTFNAGTGITLVADPTTDTLTIAAAGEGSDIFVDGADFGTVAEVVTTTDDLGSVADAITSQADLGEIVVSGVFYPSQLVLPTYTVSTLPSASIPAQMIYVSNESGGAVPAFSDGTNWRRVTDRAIVS